jgi:hypothetical protein
MILEGTVVNGAIILDQPHDLPEGARVEVILKQQSLSGADSLSGDDASLASLLELAGLIDDLPPDMAQNHDHYLHGAP